MTQTNAIFEVGFNDQTLDLFEGQYPLKNGVTYNSYIIMDDKIAIMDTVDIRAKETWLKNISEVLRDGQPDYLVVSHMEPDHGACLKVLLERYPQMTVVGNVKTFQMIHQFFEFTQPIKELVVKDGDLLDLGHHTLQFIMAPMVHWPEVMMSYEKQDKVLFSADAFGTFNDANEGWLKEARRYYTNIVGKYGMQVQNVLKKVSKLEVEAIYPLHGPVLKAPLAQYIRYYQLWSSYTPEQDGVLIVCASIHGHTQKAVQYLKEILERAGETVIIHDLRKTDLSEVVADAFCYDRLVLAASSYDGGVFSPMEDFLHHLKNKNFQNRTVALIQNGSWAPSAARAMTMVLEQMKAIEILNPIVTIKGAMKAADQVAMQNLADQLFEEGCQGENCE